MTDIALFEKGYTHFKVLDEIPRRSLKFQTIYSTIWIAVRITSVVYLPGGQSGHEMALRPWKVSGQGRTHANIKYVAEPTQSCYRTVRILENILRQFRGRLARKCVPIRT